MKVQQPRPRRAGFPAVRESYFLALGLLLFAGGCGWLGQGAAPGPKVVEPSALTVTVREPLGLSRTSWPVSTGVPFPAGSVTDASQLVVYDDTDAPRPVQSRVLSQWPDGSVRWALLDWAADLAPRQERQYRVAPGFPVTPVRAVRVYDQNDRIDVDTGPLQFSIPKRRFAWLQQVRLAGVQMISAPIVSFLDIDGKRIEALPPASVTITEAGPLRVRIEIRGHYAVALDYIVRVDAYANKPFVRILHTFEQHSSEAYTYVRRITATIPMSLRGQSWYRAGQEKGPELAGRLGSDGFALLQEDNDTLRVNGVRRAGHAAGWVDLGDETHGVALATRFFWQQYPQSVNLRPNGITYNLWAPEQEPAAVGMGSAKTHEVVLHFHGRKPRPQLDMVALTEPVLAWVDPNWTVASGALRNSVAPSAAAQPFLDALGTAYRRYQEEAASERWDDGGQVQCSDAVHERPRQGFFGMFNWGDWNYPGYHSTAHGCEAWGNLDDDMTQVLALAYTATGDRAYHEGMTAAARHYMDVDHIYYQHDHPEWVGMNHPGKPLHFSFERGGVDLGNAWTEGLLTYFYLTGDDRSLDAARGIADYLVSRAYSTAPASPRRLGWPQVALVAMYEATGDTKYRNAAEEYARKAMAAYAPGKVKDWRLGVLAEGLAYTHSVTQDAAMRRWLERYGSAVNARQATVDSRLLPAWAYVGRVTSRPDDVRDASVALSHRQFGSWGKPFTIRGWVGFAVLAPKAPGTRRR
jgi:hypothetical protein